MIFFARVVFNISYTMGYRVWKTHSAGIGADGEFSKQGIEVSASACGTQRGGLRAERAAIA